MKKQEEALGGVLMMALLAIILVAVVLLTIKWDGDSFERNCHTSGGTVEYDDGDRKCTLD